MGSPALNEPFETIPVRLDERSYEITIGTGSLGQLGQLVRQTTPTWHLVVVTDQHVEHPHAMRAAEYLAEGGIQVDVIVVPAGEPSKSVDSADALWQKMLDLGADRTSVLVAVGGGVIGDLAGFVAATYARGIRYVQVPTTLLAQVDSSVGGKVGINLSAAKNMVGVFWQPAAVLIDTEVLSTLPEREYRAGLAEVVKYGVILDSDFFKFLEDHVELLNRRDDPVLRQVVLQCCRLKAEVVQRDEREKIGLRSALNYGHTFAHALEAVTDYEVLLHGEAVSIGMCCAARLAQRLGRTDAELTERQAGLLAALGLPVNLPDVPRDRLLGQMQHDKKVEGGRLRFVLPTRLGHVELVESICEEDVQAVLE